MNVRIALAAALALAVGSAQAEDSVTINGTTYTCTNSCSVTTTGNGYTVRDCCGGRIRASFKTVNPD